MNHNTSRIEYLLDVLVKRLGFSVQLEHQDLLLHSVTVCAMDGTVLSHRDEIQHNRTNVESNRNTEYETMVSEILKACNKK